MRSNPLLSETPGRWPLYLMANGFQLPVVPPYSPLFTAVLVHIWYMRASEQSIRTAAPLMAGVAAVRGAIVPDVDRGAWVLRSADTMG